MYLSFLIGALAEVPSNLVAAALIERVGRHNTLAGGMALAGVACLVCGGVPPGAAQVDVAY
jgi:MFS family permease